jgi:hypothetical protein
MGLFSFIGKALKGVSKVAGFIPGIGGTISKITGTVGGLLDHKQPMARRTLTNPMAARGKMVSGRLWTATKIRASPVMPGGAVATPRGMMTQGSAAPPMMFSGASSAMAKVTKRKRVAAPKRRTRKTVTRARGTRKLKFGSKAWRARYMRKRR